MGVLIDIRTELVVAARALRTADAEPNVPIAPNVWDVPQLGQLDFALVTKAIANHLDVVMVE
jgi:hypothetical protein